MSTHRIAGQPANVQPNNAPPSNPTADDARVARAEWWIFNDCPDAGADAFASAVEAATVLRDSYRLSSSLAETPPAPSTAAAEAVDGTSPLDPSLTYVVIDIQPGRGGMDTFSALAQKLPKTMRATCANPLTGAHESDRIILKLRTGMRVKQRKLGRGVVIKSCDVNAVLDGHKLANSRPPAYAPQWLSNEFEGQGSAPDSVAPEGTPEPDDGNASVNTKNTKTKVGRPPGRTRDRPFQMRVDDAFITKIDDWRRQQPDFPNRTESVRRLVEQALNGKRG